MASAVPGLAANQAEFDFEAGALSSSDLGVVGFHLWEAISQPFLLEVDAAAAPGVDLDLEALLGESATLTLHLGDGTDRWVHGIVSDVSRADGGPNVQRLSFKVVPSLWRLTQTRRSRIFQEMTVPQIVQKVLKEAGIEFKQQLEGTHDSREYTVQYRESDFDFVSRLLEDEGIFYFFEHAQGSHRLILADSDSSHEPVAGDSTLVYRDKNRMVAEADYADQFSTQHQIRPTAVSLRDFNFFKPGLDLTAQSSSEGDGALEVYDYPGGYYASDSGKRRAKVRLEERRVEAATATGSSSSRRMAAGQWFELSEHPLDPLNGRYVLLAVDHRGDQSELLGAGAGGGSDGGPGRTGYRNHFRCLPADTPFRPAHATPRPVIPGPQTAVVVGPPGEEIHTDEHGRIKVQFHWDREGKRDDKSSCWIRVSQSWAGPGWGALYLPRIGHEVVVDFLEGDPDRPLVTGSVYNGDNASPIDLPDQKTKSTLRSSSSPGGDGSNELRFEDAAGSEEIYFHAQKDLDIVIENDKTQRVGGNEKLHVEKERSRVVNGNQALEVKKNDTSSIVGNQSLTVGKNRTVSVTGDHTETITGNQGVTVNGTQTVAVALAATESVGAAKVLTIGGAYSVSVGAAMNEIVGGLKAEEVLGAKTELVGAAKNETVAGERTLRVGGKLEESVGKSRTLKVAKDQAISVGGRLTHRAEKEYIVQAKEITLDAAEQFVLQVGSATLEVKKNGDIIIKGAKLDMNASGDITLKASKISEN